MACASVVFPHPGGPLSSIPPRSSRRTSRGVDGVVIATSLPPPPDPSPNPNGSSTCAPFPFLPPGRYFFPPGSASSMKSWSPSKSFPFPFQPPPRLRFKRSFFALRLPRRVRESSACFKRAARAVATAARCPASAALINGGGGVAAASLSFL
eukprot:15702-Pelagococcus_subviridis.AAC.1